MVAASTPSVPKCDLVALIVEEFDALVYDKPPEIILLLALVIIAFAVLVAIWLWKNTPKEYNPKKYNPKKNNPKKKAVDVEMTSFGQCEMPYCPRNLEEGPKRFAAKIAMIDEAFAGMETDI